MIETRGLTKRYGDLIAIESLDLSIGPGEVFGFIGPNGAGKSTTMRILACLLRPDSGTARIDGLDVTRDGDRIRRIIGYMPDTLGVYEDLTVEDYLAFFGAAYGLARARRRRAIDGALELTDLTGKRAAPVESLSRGMQQRLGVARVLLHEPRALLLDEPTSGLDPRARVDMRALLTELGRMGKCVMVSSHILSELGEMCTSLGIIEKGRLVFAGSITDAFARARPAARVTIEIERAGPGAAAVRERLLGDPRVARAVAADDGVTISVELAPGDHPHHLLIDIVTGGGARIVRFSPEPARLEDVFLRLTEGVVQ